MADKAAERIKYRTEALKILILLAVATGGGSFGLILGLLTPLRVSLAAVGFLATLVLLVAAWRRHRQIEDLIERIQGEL
jgi:hypothetical protein